MDQKQKTILLVEDEGSLRELFADRLRQVGYSVLEAENGEEGLNTAVLKHPDLILLDIIMPRMDGLTFLEKLREDEWGKDADVLMLSNLTDPAKIEQTKEKGVREMLVKSDWTIEELVEKVHEYVS